MLIHESNILAVPLSRELLRFCTNNFSERNPSFDDPYKPKNSDIPEIIQGYKINYKTQQIEIKRGLKNKLIHYLYTKNIPYQIVDNTCKDKSDFTFAFPNPSWGLREHQELGKKYFLKSGNGIISFDCGMGKTILALNLVGELKYTTIVLVHTSVLQRQWVKEINLYLKGNYTVGIIGDGIYRIGDITVALFQAFPNILHTEIFTKFGFVIVDECHHIPAETFYDVVTRFTSRCFLGLSATLNRKDCKEFLTYYSIGPCLYQKKRQDVGMIQELYLRRSLIIPKETTYIDPQTKQVTIKELKLLRGMRGSKKKFPNWVDCIGGICLLKDRTDDILYDISLAVEGGRKCLVLSDRVEHCKEIVTRLQPRYKVKLAIGGDSDNLDIYKDNPDLLDVLVGTKVADEGLDIPALDTLFLTCPFSLKDAKRELNASLLDQRVGRIARIYEGKKIIKVYLYIDMFIDFFNDACSDMINHLSNQGFKILALN